ncbi:hypothetical protein O181_010020 [Austropuccinia psidii MF-1]|uniref:ATP-dependent RNA helicase DHX37 n=1 Tax=Austropuccinia psidii MF-1 TaxID=1389203 RepID=A0A9Q3GKH0_9BASI|nr:hypothetical protein [Austropuccinia psidii MF-1]
MGFSRPRYNAKARSHKSHTPQSDTQALFVDQEEKQPESSNKQNSLLPSESINENRYKRDALDSLQASISSKRKRKFEVYFNKKLKKEKRTELIKSLEKTQLTVKDSSAFISTAHLNSSSILRSQRESKLLADQAEDRKRKRARSLLKSNRKLQSGYHSQTDSAESDLDQSDSIVAPNPFSGTVEICNAPFNHHKTSKFNSSCNSSSKTPLEIPSSKIILGSALAPDAVKVHVQKRIALKESCFNPSSNCSNSSFEDNLSYPPSQVDCPSSAQDSGCPSTFQERSQSSLSFFIDDEEEWQGCDVHLNDQKSFQQPPALVSSTSASRIKGSIRDWANLQLQLAETNQSNGQSSIELSPKEENKQNHTASASKNLAKTNPPSRCGPLGVPLDLPETPLFLHQKTIHVPLQRSEEIIASRSLLPVFAEENTVMDAIRRHPVVVVCGETGSGKTTQIPQFLYEAGWAKEDGDNPGLIGITQPRRVAAVSMAHRVAVEMGLEGSGVVAYQIRHDTTISPATKIKFMTDGVLLRELAADFLLSRYSVIIVDEAHERSVNTDVLIGVLSRVVRLRMKKWIRNLSLKDSKPPIKNQQAVYPLRLIIMSATLRVSDFVLNQTLFPESPPLVEIGARQYPVAIHFNRRTVTDYVSEALTKTIKIHTRLPPGGILIFLTGQMEIMTLCRKLEKKFGYKAVEERKRSKIVLFNNRPAPVPQLRNHDSANKSSSTAPHQTFVNPENKRDDFTNAEVEDFNLGKDVHDFAADVDQGETLEVDLEALDTDDEDELMVEGVEMAEQCDVPMHILPLYSLLPTDQQMKVFENPPDHTRLVVVATNVAETSLTIPNIRYVVDSGRAKERHYDLSTGIQSFEIDWISKASAAQRSGRAGRTGPGHCYRLYSAPVYENYFPDFSKPEIQRMPIDGIVLQMKSMNIVTVTNFPFPTPPDRYALRKAELGLAHLGALAFKKEENNWFAKGDRGGEATITDLGRAMAKYPLTPRFARMLVSGFQHGCLPYVIAIVSILSVGDPFIHETAIDEDNFGECLDENAQNEIGFLNQEEVKNQEIRRQKRRQYFQVQQHYASLGGGVSDLFKALAVVGAYEFDTGANPTKFCHQNFVQPKMMEEIHKLRGQITKIVQSMTAGISVEFSPKLLPPSELQLKVLRQLITSAFIDHVAIKASRVNSSQSAQHKPASAGKHELVAYRAVGVQEDVFIYPSSVLFDQNINSAPDFVVFQELHRTGKRVWIKAITKINPSWLPHLGKSLCNFSKPLEGSTNVTSTSDNERKCFVIPKFGGPGLDIELNPIEITQRKVGARWVWV